MPALPKMTVVASAAGACYLAAAPLFAVGPSSARSPQTNPMRGTGIAERSTASAADFGAAPAACVGVAAFAAAGLARAQGRNKKAAPALRAEPVSAAAAAAVAATKAGAAAKAATKTGAAVAAAAGAGSLTKGGKEGVAGTETPKASFDPAVQLGAMPPLGYFDPAGFCKKGDESGFRTFRAAEIKHGRVAMMAALGAVVQHYVKFPGFESVPSGLAAVTSAPGSYGMIALFLVSGALELGVWTEDPTKEPGNFGDPAGLGQYNDEMRARELNNGRFAMFAAIGIISAELLTGKDAIEQFGL